MVMRCSLSDPAPCVVQELFKFVSVVSARPVPCRSSVSVHAIKCPISNARCRVSHPKSVLHSSSSLLVSTQVPRD
jgi:hypothetical protein